MKNTIHAALILSASMFAAAPALAADELYTPGTTASQFDVAFGVAFTSQYVSRGNPQSSGPAIQAYIEPSYGIFYAGIWASNVDGNLVGIDPADRVEYDLYAGIRPEFGNLSLDIGYAHYFYDRSGQCCGEVYGKATYAFTEQFSAGVEIYHDFPNQASYGELNGALVLPYDITASAAVGTNFNGRVNWNAGLSYTFADTVTIDGRYHDASDQPARFVATISLDTTIRTLMNR